jgi:hypothetical protein
MDKSLGCWDLNNPLFQVASPFNLWVSRGLGFPEGKKTLARWEILEKNGGF